MKFWYLESHTFALIVENERIGICSSLDIFLFIWYPHHRSMWYVPWIAVYCISVPIFMQYPQILGVDFVNFQPFQLSWLPAPIKWNERIGMASPSNKFLNRISVSQFWGKNVSWISLTPPSEPRLLIAQSKKLDRIGLNADPSSHGNHAVPMEGVEIIMAKIKSVWLVYFCDISFVCENK